MRLLGLVLWLTCNPPIYGDCVAPIPEPKPKPEPDKPKPDPKPEPKPEPPPANEWEKVKTVLVEYCAYAGCHDGNTKDNNYLLEESLFRSVGIRNVYQTGNKKMPPVTSEKHGEWLDKGWIVVINYGHKYQCDVVECRK